MELTRDNNDDERIKDLKSYDILDSLPEFHFDQLTALAARICQTPIALLSFIDENRQWFKATYGLSLKEIPRYLSACNETIKGNGIYVIHDGDHEENPYREYMRKLGHKFYAGVPLISKTGNRLGTLCVIDKRVRNLTAEQLETLHVIADEIIQNLEIRKKYKENLHSLQEIGLLNIKKEKKILDVTWKRSHKSIAEFASGLNFRLRPLALNIQSSLKMLQSGQHSYGDQERIYSIDRSLKRLFTVLDNLEKYVFAEQEKWMKVVDLNEIVNEAIALVQHKILEKNISMTVHVDQEVRVPGNYTKLVESIYALLTNAVESVSTRGSGEITVELRHENREAVILVKDNGPGIDDVVKPFIFEPFFTTKSHTSQGIGLSLARYHIEEHCGTLELEQGSQPTVFKIILPTPS